MSEKQPMPGDACQMPNGDMGEMEMDDNGDMKCVPKKSKAKGMHKVGASFAPGLIKELGHGIVEVIVSTDRKDYHGESIDPAGISTKEYHGTVLYGHDYEGLPIGKAIKVWKDKSVNGLKARLQFAIDENPFAKTVYDLIKGGYLTDVSIGGIVKEWNEDYTVIKQMIMKEFSVVPIGANADAQIVAMGIGKSLDEVQVEYLDAVQKTVRAKIKDLPENEIMEAINAMEKIIAVFKGEVGATSKITATGISQTKRITLKRGAKELDRHSETIIKNIKLIGKKEV